MPAVYYKAGAHTLTRESVGTRYAAVAIRTLVDPNDPADVTKVHALQDAITVSQAKAGTFEVPDWDPVSQKRVRNALLVLSSTSTGFGGAFGKQGRGGPGEAADWGGWPVGAEPDKDATYLSETPAKNDGTTVHRVRVKDVPVDAFWSISVYNEQGYYEKNSINAYTINSITGKKAADGSTTVQFGGMRRQDRELHPDRERVELHGAPVPATRGNPGRLVEVPGGAGRALTGSGATPMGR